MRADVINFVNGGSYESQRCDQCKRDDSTQKANVPYSRRHGPTSSSTTDRMH